MHILECLYHSASYVCMHSFILHCINNKRMYVSICNKESRGCSSTNEKPWHTYVLSREPGEPKYLATIYSECQPGGVTLSLTTTSKSQYFPNRLWPTVCKGRLQSVEEKRIAIYDHGAHRKSSSRDVAVHTTFQYCWETPRRAHSG